MPLARDRFGMWSQGKCCLITPNKGRLDRQVTRIRMLNRSAIFLTQPESKISFIRVLENSRGGAQVHDQDDHHGHEGGAQGHQIKSR